MQSFVHIVQGSPKAPHPGLFGRNGPQCARQDRKQKLQTGVKAISPPQQADSIPNATEFTQQIIADEAKYVVQTYARPEIVFTHAEGCKMYDAFGKEYLDFAAGIAVNALGHADGRWVKAVQEQAETLSHASNLFHTVPQVRLAKALVDSSFADKVFYANSGTEANEAALKFSRKWARLNAGVDPYDESQTAPSELVAFTNGFHGRTMGALALTYKQQYKTPFSPMIGGVSCIPWLSFEAATAAIQKGKTAAVFVEPLQGEGGIISATPEFLQHLRDLCDKAGAVLVFDEIQCGLARTGKLWAYQHFGVEPDIMTLAKPLAGGLPIGAVLVKEHIAKAMAPGDHGSTFAGNPLVCHTAQVTFDILSNPDFLRSVTEKGEHLRSALKEAVGGRPEVQEVRGLGLICGIQLQKGMQAAKICTLARDLGLLVITAGPGDVVRMVPPLTVSVAEIDAAVEILKKAFEEAQL